ncbi:MAG: adenylate/guanylate cyclase domain-containing protein [Cellulomonadaceae bacterium]|nr:adenylate/guanylate cyclase domain-containing protein [Cellulomonadaceae bacterium]
MQPPEEPGPPLAEPSTAAPSTLDRLEDQLLGGPRTLTLAEVAEAAGVEVGDVELYWHALGLPVTPPDARIYTADDVAVIGATLRAGRDFEVSERTGVSLVRAIGHTTDRLVMWQVEALVEHMGERYGLDDTSARLMFLERLDVVAPLLERQLVHGWRRHMAATAGWFADEYALAHTPGVLDELPLARAVGFADIVGFTALTAALGSHALADFVQEFEAGARDAVTAAGGRVVKTIGDAVLFVADDVVAGAEVALSLAETFGTDAAAPVRVGLVWGRVLSRFGDVFGPSVSLASRMTAAAEPGTVLVDPETASFLVATAGFALVPQAEREVAGIGVMAPVRLDRRPAR